MFLFAGTCVWSHRSPVSCLWSALLICTISFGSIRFYTRSGRVFFVLVLFVLMFPHHSKLSCQKLCSVSFRHGTIRHIRGNARFLNFKFSVSILLLLHASSSMIVSVSPSVQVDSLATVSDFILSGFIHWHMCLFAQPPGCVFPVLPVQYQNLWEKTFRPQARQWGYRRRPRCQVANIWMFKTWWVWGNISSILTYRCLHAFLQDWFGFGYT